MLKRTFYVRKLEKTFKTRNDKNQIFKYRSSIRTFPNLLLKNNLMSTSIFSIFEIVLHLTSIYNTGFLIWGPTCGGGQCGLICQNLHENYKINILGAKQARRHGETSQFFGWGGRGLPAALPLGETLQYDQIILA